jgi:hypothetical protein
VILTQSITIIRKEANPTLVNKLTGKDLRKKSQIRYNYQDPELLDEEAENFRKIIQKAARKNTPMLKK